jgi:hypothetical protein
MACLMIIAHSSPKEIDYGGDDPRSLSVFPPHLPQLEKAHLSSSTTLPMPKPEVDHFLLMYLLRAWSKTILVSLTRTPILPLNMIYTRNP